MDGPVSKRAFQGFCQQYSFFWTRLQQIVFHVQYFTSEATEMSPCKVLQGWNWLRMPSRISRDFVCNLLWRILFSLQLLFEMSPVTCNNNFIHLGDCTFCCCVSNGSLGWLQTYQEQPDSCRFYCCWRPTPRRANRLFRFYLFPVHV